MSRSTAARSCREQPDRALAVLLLLVGCIVVGLVAAWRYARRQRAEVERRRERGLPVSPLSETFSGLLPKGLFTSLGFWIPLLVVVLAVVWVRAVFHLNR